MKQELIYPELSYKITGLLFEIHNELGRYCNEKQYGDLFEGKLKGGKTKYNREYKIKNLITDERVTRNIADFIIEDKIIIEFKCKRVIEKCDYYQLQRYLKAANLKLGLIVNFREKYLKPKRVINSD